jgi:hypothetical protein
MKKIKIYKTNFFTINRSAKMKIVEKYKIEIHDLYKEEK